MDDPDPTSERRYTDDVGTVREWADETGAVPVRTGREQEPSDEVALVTSEASGDHERLDWAAFGRVLHSGDDVVTYDGSGTAEGLSVVDADAVDDAADYEGSRTTDSHRARDTYGEEEMRGVGAPSAEAGEDRAGVDAGGERVDRDGAAGGGLLQEDVGKTVVDQDGTELGIVAQASGEDGDVHVDVDPGVTERVLSKLGWTGETDVDYEVPGERILRVTDDEVVLRSDDLESTGD